MSRRELKITAKSYPPPRSFSKDDAGGHARDISGRIFRIVRVFKRVDGLMIEVLPIDATARPSFFMRASDLRRVKQVTEWVDDP